MYLSTLLLDTGENPDRPRPARLWLRNLYRVHQRLCMAFPDAERRLSDPEFLKPYNPSEFASGHIHVPRGPQAGFLFRVDPLRRGRAVILVQSATEPDWGYAFHNAPDFLCAPPEIRTYDPRFHAGQAVRFRLLANPTRKIDTKSGPDGERRHGRRVPVPSGALFDWLASRAAAGGFALNPEKVRILAGFVYVRKDPQREGVRLRSAAYDGWLEVTNPAAFRLTVERGIGPAKAFGFGLLSVLPVAGSAGSEAT